ncbi:MAG: ABC transporter ATP-binding protein [Planctomycetaceae bacterium]
MSNPQGEKATKSIPDSEVLLDVQSMGISFGGLKAVQNFSLQLPVAGLFGLIGPNGAGKTTIFNLLTGVYRPDCGAIRLSSHRLMNRQPHEITSAGIARTFQNIRLFPDLNVLDNVRLAGQLRNRHGLLATLLRSRGHLEEEKLLEAKAFKLLEIFELQDRAHELARNLSYGHQRKLEIVRALATNPKVLLLDEPAAGLNPQEKKMLAQSIQQIRDRFHVAVLLIEHDMPLVMEICENIIVLDHGVTICTGTPAEVQNDERVIAAYLGSGISDE